MAQKILKIIFILVILLSLCISYVSATGIDLNLPGTNPDPNQTTSNDILNNADNESNITTTPDDIQNDTENNLTNEAPINDPFANNIPSTENLGATNISSQETGLGITNIINILLITVGVIIILLAIAIILRLKS